MFEINENPNIQTEFVDGSPLYTIDNFYKNPDKILELFLTIDPDLWKENQQPSYNSIYFEDRRHILKSSKIIPVYDFLSNLCNQDPLNKGKNLIFTNFARFKKIDFNDYSNNYWWPHRDYGHTAIVYFNREDNLSGTNLYENLNPEQEPPQKCPEHYKPWRNKKNYRVIKHIEPKYNRMVMFDGLKFHGMNICNDDYFSDTYRMNQVFFFVK